MMLGGEWEKKHPAGHKDFASAQNLMYYLYVYCMFAT